VVTFLTFVSLRIVLATMSTESPAERIQRRKQALAKIRERAAQLFAEGARGMQIASWLSDAMDTYTVAILRETLAGFTEAEQQELAQNSAMIAIGGSGRGEVAPYSDSDLIFIFQPRIASLIARLTNSGTRVSSWGNAFIRFVTPQPARLLILILRLRSYIFVRCGATSLWLRS
jgi:glutamine synthetase adenylyltransferase